MKKMTYRYAGSLMETRYDKGDVIKAEQLDEDRDWVVVGIDVDSDSGKVEYALMECGEEGISADEDEIIPFKDLKPKGHPRPSLANGWGERL